METQEPYAGRNDYLRRLPAENYRGQAYVHWSMIPGYPELTLWQDDFWDRFWRTYGYLQEHGLFRSAAAEAVDAS